MNLLITAVFQEADSKTGAYTGPTHRVTGVVKVGKTGGREYLTGGTAAEEASRKKLEAEVENATSEFLLNKTPVGKNVTVVSLSAVPINA